MIGGLLKKLFGDKGQKDLKELQPYVEATNVEFAKLSGLSNDELRAKTPVLKSKIKDALKEIEGKISELRDKSKDVSTPIDEKEQIFQDIEKLEKESNEKLEEILLEILPEAFAVVKETAKRFTENEKIEVTANDFDKKVAETRENVEIVGEKALWNKNWDASGTEVVWNMIHYDVQLLGGVALHKGKIAEMQTGEGKTLVATLPVYLNALSGKGLHLITVNDYLARRDALWMGPIYQFHGLTVDCIDNHEPHSPGRIEAYKADITFGTNNEFGFDYLRDNMVSDPDGLVQRKHHYAIIDEVDSVLVDDARTPLIISGPTPRGDEHEFNELKPKIEKLVTAQRKLVISLLTEAKSKLAAGNVDDAERKIAKKNLEEGGLALLRSFRGLPKNKAIIKYLSEPGMRAQLQKTENHYLQDNAKEMPKADEVLYFVIDEKNNTIDLTERGIDLISGAEDPNFYILPDIGVKMTEIESKTDSKEEQLKLKDTMITDYTVKAERIHSINQLLKAYSLFEIDVEYVVLDNKVKIVDEQTGRIMDGRRYSDGLHQAIEAKENVKVEAASQTYATITLQNYFRMYHKLSGMTGTAETEAKELWDIYELDVVVVPTNRPLTRIDKQDLVYKTAREKYNAIIEEIEALRAAGRPTLVGTTNVEISELISRMLSMKKIPHQVLNAKLHQKEAEVVRLAGEAGTVTIATNMAGRGTDIKLGKGVKEAGGLAIVATERHDSRRVDRQLRGRSGRQGDPGSSQFFVSLEDNLMRLFGSERIAKMMDRLGHKEGEVIQHGMISKSIERAQKKVEENNFGIRKRLLEFDDVMNSQRTAIYNRRKNALFGDKLDLDIDNMFYEISETISADFMEDRDYSGFELELIRILGIESPIDEAAFSEMSHEDLVASVYEASREAYVRKVQLIKDKILPVVTNVYETQGDSFENIVIPFTDGRKSLKIVANLKEAVETQGASALKSMEKSVALGLIDNEWKEHLREMDDLKSSVYLAQHEQKDPLLIYKLEGYELFKTMMDVLNKDVISFLMKAQLATGDGQEQASPRLQAAPKPDLSKLKESKPDLADSTRQNQQQAQQQQGGGQRQAPKPVPVTVGKKFGRNDKVKILNLQSGETKELKFKQAESLIVSGSWQLIEE